MNVTFMINFNTCNIRVDHIIDVIERNFIKLNKSIRMTLLFYSAGRRKSSRRRLIPRVKWQTDFSTSTMNFFAIGAIRFSSRIFFPTPFKERRKIAPGCLLCGQSRFSSQRCDRERKSSSSKTRCKDQSRRRSLLERNYWDSCNCSNVGTPTEKDVFDLR